MQNIHQIKFEAEGLIRKFICGECSFKTPEMNEYKEHMIHTHLKEQHNWMTENVKAEFVGEECDSTFSTQESFSKQIENPCDYQSPKIIQGTKD